MGDDLDKRLRAFQRNGWYPVPYRHHPRPIRDALRRIGLRPAMKQCFANCQRFVLNVDWLDVEYHEGYVTATIPIPHAWVVWEGQIIDLTLKADDNRDIIYHGSTVYSRIAILANVRKTEAWCVIDERALMQHHPLREEFELLRRLGPSTITIREGGDD